MPDPTALTMADTLGKTGPALSATSDIPALSPAPAPAEPAPGPADAPAPAPEPADPPADASGQDTDGNAKTGEDQTPPWLKAEITKERNKRRAAEQQATEANARVDALIRELQARRDPATPPVDAPAAPTAEELRPQRESFDDPNAYDDALIEWTTRKATRETEQRAAEAARQAEQTRQITEVQTNWNNRRESALAEMPDYVEVAENPNVQISMAMASVITTVDNGPALAYHLGKNPELASQIAALPPAQAMFKMGELAANLAAAKKVPPPLTNAPEPITPLRGLNANATSKDANEESMEEYAARRQKELHGRR